MVEIPDLSGKLPQFIIDAATRDGEFTDLVIFVGAGFSRLFGMPGWNRYAREKLREYKKDKALELDYATEENLLSSGDNDPRLLLSVIQSLIN